MQLPVPIGKTSDNELVVANLATMPNLFISAISEEAIIYQFQATLNQLANNSNVFLAFYCSYKPNLPDAVCNNCLLNVVDYNNQPSLTKAKFIASLYKLWNKRMQQKEKAVKPLDPLIVFVDEIITLLTHIKKQTSLYLFQLLALGHEVNMHFIVATKGVYNYLLKNLMQLQPTIVEQLAFKPYFKNRQFNHLLGAKLIISADALRYFYINEVEDEQRLFDL